jgi:hypothetical protein
MVLDKVVGIGESGVFIILTLNTCVIREMFGNLIVYNIMRLQY